MAELKAVVFDIDDTLYLERDFVHSGFKAVADFLSDKEEHLAKKIFEFVWNSFKQGSRGNTFDLLFENFPSCFSNISVQDLVRIYREHSPAIKVPEAMKELINSIKENNIFLGAISDGDYTSQTNKIAALGLKNLFDEIVLTDTWGKEFWKPHSRAFEFLENRFGLNPDQILYIGDNPKKDFIAPNIRGWLTIRLLLPGQLNYNDRYIQKKAEPHYIVYSIQELSKVLRCNLKLQR